MKKVISCVTLVCSLFASTGLFAQLKNAGQEAATKKGDMILDFGVGVLGGDYSGYDYYNYNNNYNNNNHWNSNNKIQIPTLSVSLQKAFWDDITIGGQIAFNAFGNKYDYTDNNGYYSHSKYTQTNSFIMARGEYHFNRLIGLDPKYDLYAGVLAGMRISISKQTDNYDGYNGHNGGTPYQNNYADHSSTNVGPDGGLFGGFRYYFGKNIAVYGEVGWAITNFRAGLAWKL